MSFGKMDVQNNMACTIMLRKFLLVIGTSTLLIGNIYAEERYIGQKATIDGHSYVYDVRDGKKGWWLEGSDDIESTSDVKESYVDGEGHFSFNYPSAWTPIPKETIDSIMHKISKTSGTKFIDYDTGFQLKTRPFISYPYVYVQYKQGVATVEDVKRNLGGKLSADVNTFKKFYKINNLGTPYYDEDRQAFYWKMGVANVDGVGEVLGLASIVLGSKGLTTLMFYSTVNEYEKYVKDFERMVNSFAYESGYEYQESRVSVELFDGVVGKAMGGFGAAILIGLFLFFKKVSSRRPRGN